MDDMFQKKVRAAAVAGWWTLLIAVILAVVMAGMFALVLNVRPTWMTALFGGTSWETIQATALWMFAAYRVLVWVMFLLVVWLTIWSARLKRIQ